MNDRLVAAFKNATRKVNREDVIYAHMGKNTPSGHIFEVRGRKNYVYVTLRQSIGSQTNPIARNDAGIEFSYGLPIKMHLENGLFVIDGVARRDDLATVDAPPDSGVPVHIHDDRYFREDEHLNVSAGAADAGKPIKLDAGGKLDASLIDSEDISDIVGTMVTGNTETDIAVTYQDADNTLDFVVSSTLVADRISAAATDDTIGDTDLWGYVTGGVLVKTAWSNIKAVLRTAFDAVYVLAGGKAGGQTVKGGTASGDDLTLMSTDHATKGNINLGNSTYDEVNNRLGVNQLTPLAPLHVGAGNDTPTTSAANVMIYAAREGNASIVARDTLDNVETVVQAFINGGLFGTQTNHTLFFRSNGVDNGALTPAGDFGFGITSSLQAKVHILQATLGNVVQRLQSTATNDDVIEDTLHNRVATTDATVTTLHTIAIASGKSYLIRAHVLARRTGGASGAANDSAGYGRVAVVKDVSGVATLVGAVASLYTMEDQAGWNVTIDVTGATAIVRVVGAASNNITWHLVRLEVAELGT